MGCVEESCCGVAAGNWAPGYCICLQRGRGALPAEGVEVGMRDSSILPSISPQEPMEQLRPTLSPGPLGE